MRRTRSKSPAPPPGDLRVVQSLLDAYGHARKTGQLESPMAFSGWLAELGLGPEETKLSSADHECLLGVCRALLRMVYANHGQQMTRKSVEDLDRAAARVHLAVRFSGPGTGRIEASGSGFEHALGRLLHAVVLAQQEDRWKRMKVCFDKDCRRVYYDLSPNLSSKWCTERCGNRRSAQRARRRKKSRGSREQRLFDEVWESDFVRTMAKLGDDLVDESQEQATPAPDGGVSRRDQAVRVPDATASRRDQATGAPDRKE